MARVTPEAIGQMKARGERIPMLTAYDYATAQILDATGIPLLLVGDSLGMVVLGHESTLPVTVDDIIRHTQPVVRGSKQALIIADLPFGSFQVSPEETMRHAVRIMKKAAPQAVKLEGGVRSAASVRALTQAGIPVMGHVGMTPQSVNRLGGFRVQRDEDRLFADALAIEKAGAFALVVECVPAALAEKLTAALKIPTIGIGAGVGCDGQILVTHDMLGLFADLQPRFVKQYADLGQAILRAVGEYCREVREGSFPGPEHEFR
jgi:3-methyl-2-oxobutanoate hydroxymethyltransferase